jgi:hypothetical protein
VSSLASSLSQARIRRQDSFRSIHGMVVTR